MQSPPAEGRSSRALKTSLAWCTSAAASYTPGLSTAYNPRSHRSPREHEDRSNWHLRDDWCAPKNGGEMFALPEDPSSLRTFLRTFPAWLRTHWCNEHQCVCATPRTLGKTHRRVSLITCLEGWGLRINFIRFREIRILPATIKIFLKHLHNTSQFWKR